jgi:hypothetical protein
MLLRMTGFLRRSEVSASLMLYISVRLLLKAAGDSKLPQNH